MKKLFKQLFGGKNAEAENKENTVIAVLGMHRSGTSCLTGLLEETGVFLGEVSKKDPFNRKGNHELKSIRLLQEEVLEANGASWDNPPTSVLSWTPKQSERLAIQLAGYGDKKVWGFKDPRTLLMLEKWTEMFPDLHYIGTIRHPRAVAQSLFNRGKVPIEKGLALWEDYNRRMLDCWKKQAFPIVNFDLEPEVYLKSVRNAVTKLELPVETSQLQFFDDSLRNADRNLPEEDLPESCLSLYNELLEISSQSLK